MSKPGVVLKQPAGSNGRFAEHSDLPSNLGSGENGGRQERCRPKRPKRTAPKISEPAARKAAADFDKEQKRREADRRREEAAMAKERERRENAVAKAQAALDDAKAEHDAKAATIEAERVAVEKRAEEEVRWEKRKEKLEAALRQARK